MSPGGGGGFSKAVHQRGNPRKTEIEERNNFKKKGAKISSSIRVSAHSVARGKSRVCSLMRKVIFLIAGVQP